MLEFAQEEDDYELNAGQARILERFQFHGPQLGRLLTPIRLYICSLRQSGPLLGVT